jgi:hypothetical protein
MRHFSDKLCKENQNIFYVQCLFSRKSAFYEIMWKNSVEPSRPKMKVRRMRIACWIHNATNTHSEYVIRIAFPRNNCCMNALSVTLFTHCLSWLTHNRLYSVSDIMWVNFLLSGKQSFRSFPVRHNYLF